MLLNRKLNILGGFFCALLIAGLILAPRPARADIGQQIDPLPLGFLTLEPQYDKRPARQRGSTARFV